MLNPWGITYIVGNVYDTKFPSNYFDYAVAGELIEHLEYPERFLAEALRILKKRGILAISTPLEETGIGEVDNERHLWSYSGRDLKNLLSPYGSVRIRVLRGNILPYRYHFPSLIAFCKKK